MVAPDDIHGVLRAVRKQLRTAFKFLHDKKLVVPPYGVHFYADMRAEMFPVRAVSDVDVFKLLASTVRRAGHVGTAFVAHSDPVTELHPCFAANVNLPDRGVVLVLKYKNTPAGPVAQDVEMIADVELPGNLERKDLAN